MQSTRWPINSCTGAAFRFRNIAWQHPKEEHDDTCGTTLPRVRTPLERALKCATTWPVEHALMFGADTPNPQQQHRNRKPTKRPQVRQNMDGPHPTTTDTKTHPFAHLRWSSVRRSSLSPSSASLSGVTQDSSSSILDKRSRWALHRVRAGRSSLSEASQNAAYFEARYVCHTKTPQESQHSTSVSVKR